MSFTYPEAHMTLGTAERTITYAYPKQWRLGLRIIEQNGGALILDPACPPGSLYTYPADHAPQRDG